MQKRELLYLSCLQDTFLESAHLWNLKLEGIFVNLCLGQEEHTPCVDFMNEVAAAFPWKTFLDQNFVLPACFLNAGGSSCTTHPNVQEINSQGQQ